MRHIYYNGKISTQNLQQPSASAFVEEDGRFLAVGSDAEMMQYKNEFATMHDLGGQYVLPGFYDAHIHIWKVGNLMTYMLDLRGVQSLEEMLDKLNDYAKQHPELLWIQARGFNEAEFPDGKMPDRFDLDGVISDRPVCVTRTCAHQVIVNSKALEVTGITKNTIAPAGGEIRYLTDGQLAGHFTETAIGLILSHIPKYQPAELRKMILAAQEAMIKSGITSATDPAVDSELLEVYKTMDAAGELLLRINAIPVRVPDGVSKILPLPAHHHTSHLHVNTVKFFADGGLSGKTAALKHPYKNTSEHGVLRLEKKLFRHLARESQDAGFKIATHAIGDAAIEMVLDVYEAIDTGQIHHRIEHLGLPSAGDLKRMEKISCSAVMQPVFIHELGKNFLQYLHEQYLNDLYPCHAVLDAGINLALSTDAPVVKNFTPLANIDHAITRQTAEGEMIGAEHRITRAEAIRAYTCGSAVANDEEDEKGSIAPGKYADFLVMRNESDNEVRQVYIGGAQPA